MDAVVLGWEGYFLGTSKFPFNHGPMEPEHGKPKCPKPAFDGLLL